jgi:beta-glucosidase
MSSFLWRSELKRIVSASVGRESCLLVSLSKELSTSAHLQLTTNLRIQSNRLITTGSRHDPINEAGIEYYLNLIDRLLLHGIEPIVTIFHWDTPEALDASYGSWRNHTEMVPDFTAYARILFERFGDRVSNWITINEVSG